MSLSNEQLMLRAEQAFQQGCSQRDAPDRAARHFHAAAGAYRKILGRGVTNAALYRNLGNAEFLADRLPEALLAWRQGLELAPGDAELRANLDYARQQVEWPASAAIAPPAFVWPVGCPYPDALQIVIVLLIVWLGTCTAGWRWWLVRHVRWLWTCMLGMLCVVALSVFLVWQFALPATGPIVIVARDNVVFRTGNGSSYPVHDKAPTLARGMEARLVFEREGWVQIEFVGGAIGWVPRSAVVIAREELAPLKRRI